MKPEYCLECGNSKNNLKKRETNRINVKQKFICINCGQEHILPEKVYNLNVIDKDINKKDKIGDNGFLKAELFDKMEKQ